ncbi:hypothetical protein [Alkalicoccus urumqiensis]|uniref:Uncharacterized protein n=1 Tax=Alkalicoccus urumqiensis TaxID=1548213 RepID=A0A2P6MJF7_ALKUR|nr:hypothetical protein [Alkalicoccus urumqiensis]PRO66395.1 hypothetical protein C6I21_03380 [Alkalicoccus urumqiensis]
MSDLKTIELKQIAYQELLIEVQEVYEVLHRLKNSDAKITAYISTSLIPYLCFLCDGLDYFHKGTNKVHSNWYNDIKGNSVQKLVKENRSALKLYSDYKKNKVIPKLEDDTDLFNELLIGNYNLIQKAIIKSFGQHDLGIYSFRNIDYANTYQLFKNLNTLYFDNEIIDSVIKEFGRILANYISKASIYPVSKSPHQIFSFTDNFTHQDVYFKDSKRFNAFNNKEDKYWQLFLYNYYCQNNFIRDILPVVLGVRRNFYYRMKFCSYLLSIKGLDLLLKKVPKITEEHPSIIELINARETIVPINSDLRNNLFHYGIANIPYESFDENKNLLTQIVEYSVMRPFEEFDNLVDQELDKYQKLISEILFRFS